MDNDQSERMALFRYSVISSALDAGLSAAERGLIVRSLANRTWTTPTGEEQSFSRGTIDRWVAAYRADGLGGLAPNPRTDRGQVRVETQWMAEAVRLRREVPARSGLRSSTSSDEPTGSG